MLELMMSTGILGVSLILAILVTYIALRETRKKYVPATTTVLQRFSIQTEVGNGEPYVHIVGRHKGIIAWLLLSLGIENKVELKVTDMGWTLHSGSLAGMVTDYHPLKNVNATVCGYQRSIVALFFSVYFGLSSIGTFLGILPKLFDLTTNHSEFAVEMTSKGISLILASTLISMILWGIAFLIFYTSKRVSFGVEAGGANHGFVFKRSVIENKVIDLAEAERATALINQLFAAAVYGVPLSQVPRQPTQASVAVNARTPWVWIASAAYFGLIVLSPLLWWYGNGVNVNVTTAPPGVAVLVDDKFVGFTTKDSNEITIPHFTREDHTFEAQLSGYEPLKQTVHVGGLRSTQNVGLQLIPLKYPLTLYTSPAGSHVTLDGKDAGVTDGSTGKITIPEVEHGTHQVTVSSEGFQTYTGSIEIFSGPRGIRIELVNEAQAAQQEAQAHQQEITAHLDRGRMLFQQGQYQQALDECDAALKLDPGNAAVSALKSQIEQTRKVLGQ